MRSLVDYERVRSTCVVVRLRREDLLEALDDSIEVLLDT